MTKVYDVYTEPLVGRYTAKEMQQLFSSDFKFKGWRSCWIALAEAQMELGLPELKPDINITPEVIAEMIAQRENIDYERAAQLEEKLRHDVMGHLRTYGEAAPSAAGIMHLGATSMFVCDNTELIQHREGLKIVKRDLVNTIANVANFAREYKGLVTLGFTHYQPAQEEELVCILLIYY